MDEKKNEEKTNQENINQENQEENSYEFLKETIKAKPVDTKKLAQYVGKLLLSGAVLGLTAAVVFSLAAPPMTSKMIEKRNEEMVRFPQEKDGEEKGQTKEADSGGAEGESTNKEEQEKEAAATTTVVQEMTPEDYKKLYADIFDTAAQAEKAMVTVIGNKNDENWFLTPYEERLSGVLVAESGQNYYVLTEYRIVEDVDRIQVVFCDGTVTDAIFQKSDKNTGCAVLKISKSSLDIQTKEKIAVAPLGESYNVQPGEPVLAIGSPMGYSDSVGYGIVTSISDKVSRVDVQYGLLTTDITGSSKGSGVILDLEGEIVGIIAQNFAEEENKSLITGLQISQIKDLIQTLSDETKEMVYLGITGADITAEISEKKGIPVGVFVEQVEVDSPAMQVGIQNGDVITELNGETVETVKGYGQQLKSCRPGETVKVKAMRQGVEGYVEVSFDVTLKTR